jgi:hypothetical protein
MGRIAVFLIISGVALAPAAWAGTFGFGMGVAYYRPPEEGASYTTLYTGSAYYWINKHVVPSLEVGYSRYDVDGTKYNYIPVIPRVAYHFALTKVFDPYAGLGLVYAHKWWSGGNEGVDDMWGFTGLAGINVAATEKFVIGLGVEYVVPDAGDFDSAYPAFRVGLGAVGL